MGETNADFLTGMSTVAKRISKINKQSDFVKLQKEIQKALNGMEEAQAGLDVFLNSADAHFAAISQTQGALTDRQIEELLAGRVTERELLMDARIDAVLADLGEAPSADKADKSEERQAELDGGGPQVKKPTIAKPFPAPRGVFEFAPKTSPEVSFDVFGEDGEVPLKSVVKIEEKPTLIIGKTADGIKRVSLSDSPITLVSGMIGSGKSAFMHSAICSLAVSLGAEKLKLLLFDFHGEELCAYDGTTHMAADTITSVQEVMPALKAVSAEIDRRYEVMGAVGKNNIDGYNETAEQKLPYILIVFDEYSDAMVVSEFERELLRLMRNAEGAGVYFLLATRNSNAETATPALIASAKSKIVFRTATAEVGGVFGAPEAAKLTNAGELVYVGADGSKTICRAPYISSSGVARTVSAIGENIL